ncbi:MAG: NAD(+)/NADH kinase [Myxococcaceae bacterium]
MKTLFLVAKRDNPEAVALARQIQAKYPQLTLLAEAPLGKALGLSTSASGEALAQKADLVVTLGGDGTLIRAARLLQQRTVPILAVNLGTLGFLTQVKAEDLFARLDDALAGRLAIDARMTLSCTLRRKDKVIAKGGAFNDVVVNRSGALARISDYELWLDGKFVSPYKADGIVIATATGSTAYSLSAGGPILHPSIDAIVVSPICPHSLTQRPLVLPGDRTLEIILLSQNGEVSLTIDGQDAHALQPGDRIEVRCAPARVHLLLSPQDDYFAILRQKLQWGERGPGGG